MNGYLNNLTLRTLNAGNRVEPRLPALFEPSGFESGPAVERSASFEEEVTTVGEPKAPLRVGAEGLRGEAPSSGEVLPDRPRFTEPEIEVSAAVPGNGPVALEEDVDFEPVSHEQVREDPVRTLTVEATLQARTETVENATQVVENDSPIETEETSLEGGGPTQLSPRTSLIDNKAAPGRRTPKGSPTPPAALIPTPSPQLDDFQSQITFRRTTPANAPIGLEQNEEIPEIEQRVANNPEPTTKPATGPEREFDPAAPSTYRRVNPTPAPWRDTRQQQWRRRQLPLPVESEPSINVTIGRIEVRAVPADSRKTPRRSESPVMPLEDYLRKQRRGGER